VKRKELSASADERGIPMSEPETRKSAIEEYSRLNEEQGSKPDTAGLSRRTFLEVGSVSLAGAALASLAVNAQERADTEKAEQNHSFTNPGPENKSFWMKIRIPIFHHRPITETSLLPGTPLI
jgi:hypothetical protein